MPRPSNNFVVTEHRPSDDMLSAARETEAKDTRTLAEKWLGDPAPGRSALDQRQPPESKNGFSVSAAANKPLCEYGKGQTIGGFSRYG
jgi:hypothetical protein